MNSRWYSFFELGSIQEVNVDEEEEEEWQNEKTTTRTITFVCENGTLLIKIVFIERFLPGHPNDESISIEISQGSEIINVEKCYVMDPCTDECTVNNEQRDSEREQMWQKYSPVGDVELSCGVKKYCGCTKPEFFLKINGEALDEFPLSGYGWTHLSERMDRLLEYYLSQTNDQS